MIKYDFHIHSCLSPCGSDDMTPANIAGMSMLAGLDAIALCDHNTALNVPSIIKACGKYGVKVLCGIEVCTAEDIHVVCYFKTAEDALAFSENIEENTLKFDNDAQIYGHQYIMDAEDGIVGEIPHLLISGCNYSVYELVDICHQMGGKCFYAHIDKPSYSVLSVLGVIPEDIPIDGVEIFNMANYQQLISGGFITEDTPYMSNSDAHQLELIGCKESEMAESHPLYEFLPD